MNADTCLWARKKHCKNKENEFSNTGAICLIGGQQSWIIYIYKPCLINKHVFFHISFEIPTHCCEILNANWEVNNFWERKKHMQTYRKHVRTYKFDTHKKNHECVNNISNCCVFGVRIFHHKEKRLGKITRNTKRKQNYNLLM